VTILVQRQAGAVQALDAFPFALRLANAAVAYAVYVGQSCWPAALAALYPYPASVPLWKAAAALAALVGMSVLAVRALARRPYVPVGWFWFVGMLVPVIGLVQVGSQPYADRYTYVPLVGLAIVVVWGAAEVLGRWRHGRTVGVVAALLVLIACTIATRHQAAVWKDGVTLWQHAVGVTRDNYRAHTNLGQALTSAGRAYEAMPHFEAALRINPSFAPAHNYFGLALLSRGEVARAIEHHRQAVTLRPRFVEAHNNLGLALAADGRLEEAVGAFSSALEIDPEFAPAHTNRGTALAELGRLEEALGEFREAERLQPPSAQAQLNLGAVLTNLGRPVEAIGHYEAALRIDPAEPAALHGWGNALARQGKFDDALAKYNEALRVLPRLMANPGFRFDVAVAFARKGARLEAIQELEAALRLDPSHQAARQLLKELQRD
jgi:tetratricopeptide (TPR) repeat protein